MKATQSSVALSSNIHAPLLAGRPACLHLLHSKHAMHQQRHSNCRSSSHHLHTRWGVAAAHEVRRTPAEWRTAAVGHSAAVRSAAPVLQPALFGRPSYTRTLVTAIRLLRLFKHEAAFDLDVERHASHQYEVHVLVTTCVEQVP